MENVIVKKITSCMGCHAFGFYYPTDDSFDEDKVGYCTDVPNRKGDANEMGYGRKPSDFPIPSWCPILLKQKAEMDNKTKIDEELEKKMRLEEEVNEEYFKIMGQIDALPEEKRKLLMAKFQTNKN